MKIKTKFQLHKLLIGLLILGGCVPKLTMTKKENTSVPASYKTSQDTTNVANIVWKDYFKDPNLIALIDTALSNNQELNITMQEIQISKNEVKAKKGEYLPFIGLGGGANTEKTARYTRIGALEKNIDIKPNTAFPEPLQNYMLGASATWELDVWKKLRNAKKSALSRYLASVEGRNFMVTNLIAEIASKYYELMALDNQLDIIKKNIEIQKNALEAIKQEKAQAKVTLLAVNRFEAQWLNTQNLQYEIQQEIVEAENSINYLIGAFPKTISRNSLGFNALTIDSISSGIPSQLLQNRPDIKQAELNLTASKLDVKSAKANFYPSFKISASTGLEAFNPAFLVSPESMLYTLAGDFVSPLINRNAIKAMYFSANAKQIQMAYNYERTVLNAVIEVNNQLSRLSNFQKSFETKAKEADILSQSVNISNNLFKSARADYTEVLLTQREALESKMALIEIKTKQLNAKVGIYKALGGGWK